MQPTQPRQLEARAAYGTQRARELAKLVFEISLGSWKHARGIARSMREFAKLVFEMRQLEARAGYGMQHARANLRNWSSKSA